MPSTLDRVDEILALLAGAGAPPPTLLVVAGKDWNSEGIDWLRGRVEAGPPLAGHGWTHQAAWPRSLYHRLHAALISGDQGEHLSRSPDELRAVVRQCHAWFGNVDLPSPRLYVPPAWELGALTQVDLRTLPFPRYETLTGFIDAATGRRTTVPLVGFEAPTALTSLALRTSNSLNLLLARAWRGSIRVALHPRDLELRLRDRVRGLIAQPWAWTNEPGGFPSPAR
jgi:hypothetical protein